MKLPPKPVLVIALALIGATAWYVWPRTEDAGWLGYVEAETLYVAAPVAGRLAQRAVDRGGSVAPGDPLFALDAEISDADTAQAAAQVAAAQAQVRDLAAARSRAPELAAAQAAAAQANAQAVKTQADFERIAALAQKGFASRSQLDAARAARDAAAAARGQARAQVAAGELTAGREGQLGAAAAQAAGASAALRAQQQRRREIAPVAPVRGVVEQTYYNPGEWVPANAPVVSILPDDKRKLRFFVPEDAIAALRVGSAIGFDCDGCGAGRTAKVSYIAPRAEFTPPVIYSEQARAKLVFMVEALLPPSEKPLPPGLPIAVRQP